MKDNPFTVVEQVVIVRIYKDVGIYALVGVLTGFVSLAAPTTEFKK